MRAVILAFILVAGKDDAVALDNDGQPSPEMMVLEREIRDRRPERSEDIRSFRSRLESAFSRASATRANRAAKERIEALLAGGPPTIEALNEALARNPNHPGLLVAKGQAYLRSGDYSGALAAAETVLGMKPAPDARLVDQARALRSMSEGRGRFAAEAAASRTEPAATDVNGRSKSVEDVIAEANALPQARPTKAHAVILVKPLQFSGGFDAAPEASMADRIRSLITPDDGRIAQDIATVRAMAEKVIISEDTISLGSKDFEAPRKFVQWLRTAKDEDLPPIAYGILPPGRLGQYEQNLFFPDSIRMNYLIRDAEPEARAAALVHEIFHHWDLKLSGAGVGGMAYHIHSPEGERRREYSAFQMTQIFWSQNRPGNAASPTSKDLDAIPGDADALMRHVDEILKQGEAR